MIKTKSWLPIFSGFYGTTWDNSNNDSEISYLKDEGLTDEELDELSSLKCYDEGISDYRDNIVSGITDIVCRDLISLGVLKKYELERLVSPKEYNFANDSINITYYLTKNNVKAIKNYINNHAEEWSKFLKDNYTSYSGFWSHYDNFPESADWYIDSIVTGEHQLGKVYEFILTTENDADLEWHYRDYVEAYESYGSAETIRAELKERGFYDDKPEILAEIEKQKEQAELKEYNLQFQFNEVK